MTELLILAICLANLVYLVHNMTKLYRRIEALERVGVLFTADKKTEVNAKPMSPREKIRWAERRMNGAQRITP